MIRARLGIRAKFAATLAVVAMLPLLIVLVATVMRWSLVRKDITGQGLLSLTMAEARGLSVSLVKDIQALQMGLHNPTISTYLVDSPALTPAQWQELDAQWPTLTPDSPALSAILKHPIVPWLRQIEEADPRILQSFVTDQYGQLVAATRKTNDYYQADEDWWQHAYDEGRGQIVVSPVEFDPSVQAHTLQVCLPIYEEDVVVGVANFKLDLGKWLASSIAPDNSLGAKPMLVRDDGTILYRRGLAPLSQKAERYGPIVRGRRTGWTIYDEEFQGHVPIAVVDRIGGTTARMPRMSLVMYVSEAPIMRPMYRIAAAGMLAGLLIIGSLFLTGLLMADRLIVRRIRRLESAARVVASGDLSGRVAPSRHRLGFQDEIDDLVHDFNEMASRVERTHQELSAANELKSNFIKVASHELRTPISYILGVIKLLRSNRDPERLANAMTSIAMRAQRLDDIIHAMFKLLPEQLSEQMLRYEDVSLQDLLEEVYVECFPFVEQREQKLKIEVAPHLPILRADRDKMRDVIENLVINAIKFTPDHGQVTVTIRAEMDEAVSIAVADQGSGIPEKDLPYLFQPFYSGGEVLQHSTGESGYQKRGMGLGLAIVRHFVELHGGTVTLATGPSGCTFTVVVPVRRPASLEHRPDYAI